VARRREAQQTVLSPHPDGEQIFAQLLGEWQAINASVTATLNSTTDAGNGTL